MTKKVAGRRTPSNHRGMEQRPNILWIVTTQWRAQACGYAGDSNVRTPQLDAFAGEAANFVAAVTPHPFGPFARAALFTGVPSPANGVGDYFDPLPPTARTIANEANDAGYATAFFGKWHLAPRSRTAPLVGEAHARTLVPPEYRGGFQWWEGFESGFLLNDPWLHGSRLREPIQVPGYQSDVLCARGADWIAGAKAAGRPWFAVVSLEAPHPPYAAPAAGMVGPSPSEIVLPANVPRGGAAEARAREELSGYYAHIAATDRAIGRLVAATDPDTVVAVTSVHGDMHGAHGLFRKGWPHEESVRVPLLVRVPAARRGEAWMGVRRELVTLLDLYDWTSAWITVKPALPEDHDRQEISMPSVVALPHQCDRVWRGIRTRERKLILVDEGGEPKPWLGFDLKNDPGEERNRADDPAWRDEIDDLVRRVRTNRD